MAELLEYRRPRTPRLVSLAVWYRQSGMSPAATHAAIAAGELKLVRDGQRLKIDTEQGHRLIDRLPPAA